MSAAPTTLDRTALVRGVAAAYAALWVSTALGAALASVAGLELTVGVPHDALPADPRATVELLAHNVPVTLWPLALVALRWPSIWFVRNIGDSLVAVHLLGHGLLVGSALGLHPDMWRWLTHLPIEWLALSAPVGAWVAARTRARVGVLPSVVLTLAALLGAAVVETYAAPV